MATSFLPLIRRTPLRRHPTRCKHRQIRCPAVIQGHDGLRPPRSELALDDRRWLPVLQPRRPALPNALSLQPVKWRELVRPEVIARVDALTEMHTSLVVALVRAGLQRVEELVLAAIRYRAEVAIRSYGYSADGMRFRIMRRASSTLRAQTVPSPMVPTVAVGLPGVGGL